MAEKKASLLILLKDKVSKGLGVIGGRLDKLTAQLNKSKLVFAGITAVTGLAAKAFIGAADKMEQWTISFETMIGSAEGARAMMEDLREFAKETPFELPDVVIGAKRLMAFGIEGEKIIPTMKALGDVSAGLGVPMERLVLNFGQVKSQAKLTGRELRDFAIAGVPLVAELAKNLNVAESSIAEMVSAGKIGFPEVEAAFISMTSEGGKFNDLMLKQMTTLTGVVSNVKDQFFQLSAELGNYLLPIAKQVGLTILNLFTWIRELTPKTKLLILAVGGLVGVFTGLITALAGIVVIAPAVAAAFAIMTGPIGIITAGVLGLGVVLTAIGTNAFQLKDTLLAVFTEIGEILTLFAEAWHDTVTFKFDEAKEKMAEAFERMKEIGTNTWETLKDNVSNSIDGIVKKFQKGKDTIFKIEKKEQKKLVKLMTEEEKKEKERHIVNFKAEIDRLNLKEKQRQDIIADSLNRIATLSTAKNKALAFIGKGTAISMATIDTYRAGAKALASAPPPFNYALMAGVIAAGLANVSKIAGVPLAEGGIVLPRAGGTFANIGERGKAEAVIPLDDEEAQDKLGSVFGGATTININAGTIIADEMSIKEFASKIDEELFRLRENKESLAF